MKYNCNIIFLNSPPETPPDDAITYNQVGQELKGRAHTYYQVLIDARDCPYIVSKIRS